MAPTAAQLNEDMNRKNNKKLLMKTVRPHEPLVMDEQGDMLFRKELWYIEHKKGRRAPHSCIRKHAYALTCILIHLLIRQFLENTKKLLMKRLRPYQPLATCIHTFSESLSLGFHTSINFVTPTYPHSRKNAHIRVAFVWITF